LLELRKKAFVVLKLDQFWELCNKESQLAELKGNVTVKEYDQELEGICIFCIRKIDLHLLWIVF